MIPAVYYKYIYILVVLFFSFFCFDKYRQTRGIIKESNIPALLYALVLVVFIGMRPVHPTFYDTVGYAQYYEYMMGTSFEFSVDVENLIFDNLLHYMSSVGLPCYTFFLLIAFIYFVGRYIACRKMFPDNSWAAFLVFLGAFITFASSVNGFKAGAAASLFVCAVAYREKKWLAALLLAVSWGFHHSMIICIASYVVVYLYKNTKVYSAFWVFALLVAIAHITTFQELFSQYVNEKGAGYLMVQNSNTDEGWYTGMRYDFVLYSFMPILVGWYNIFRKGVRIPEYTFVFNLYLLLNALWMLCMYANFTNRIAALSWLLYPIVIIYPYLSDKNDCANKNKMFAIIMSLHLAFTLFMTFIYY